jgi:hypothetical protein
LKKKSGDVEGEIDSAVNFSTGKAKKFDSRLANHSSPVMQNAQIHFMKDNKRIGAK